jgi:hypothetical protein
LIPELFDGVLPEGIHSCTIEEIEKVFGKFNRSDKRVRLTEKLRAYIGEAQKVGNTVALIVDGSYITAKPEPSDIDLILVLQENFDIAQEVSPFEYNIQSKRMVKRLYGFDILPAVEQSEAYNAYLEFFAKVRKDDPEQKTNQFRKGLLRIEL